MKPRSDSQKRTLVSRSHTDTCHHVVASRENEGYETFCRHVDREKTCPLLLRVFTKTGGHHTKEDYAVRGKEPKDKVQIYTWKDVNLRELTDLVKEVSVAARRRNARLSFVFVYPGRFILREVGQTTSYPNRKLDDCKTLSDLGFEIGDYLDVAIYL